VKKLLTTVVCFIGLGSLAQDEMTAAQQRMMEMGTPDAHHKLLGKMAGTHEVKSQFRMASEAPWTEATFSGTSTMIMGGRYLFMKATGDFMGMPFEGQGVMGFDKEKKKFISTWIDNFSTMLLVAVGDGDLEKQQIVTVAEMIDPSTGNPTKMKMVYTIKSDTEYTLEMSIALPNGDWLNNMNMSYTKVE